MTYFAKTLESKGQEKENIRISLLKYCEPDTLTIVEILKVLYKLVEIELQQDV